MITLELAREIAALALEMRRQVGILVNRSGDIEYVIIGDERRILIPVISDYPLGRRMLRGLRLIHTHLREEALSDDDLTDLAILRLDLMVALQLSPNDTRINIQIASLSPPTEGHASCHVEPPQLFDRFRMDFDSFVTTLETSLEKATKGSQSVKGSEERGILISATQKPKEETKNAIDELKELARTAGVEVLDTIIQHPRKFNPRYHMGEGKIRDVVIHALQLGATLLIFDQELTPTQIRSISELTELKVIDRSQLILDIFARRAKSLDGKVQVELAQLKYLLPRLTGHGVQMSRLMGGIGGRGPGETKLEVDRRRIRDRIAKLERELKNLSHGRYQRRQKRVKAGVPIVSIVGYTNAGKSTLLNALTKSTVFTENLLFATLDTSTRRLRFPREREVIITDTVGFIHSLPKSLMGAFKATLEELQDADLLLHLVDCANERFEDQITQVDQIIADLDLADKPQLIVFNKADHLPELKRADPLAFLKTRHLARRHNAIFVSALDPRSLEPLLAEMEQRFWASDTQLH